jgi:hypothetical protein
MMGNLLHITITNKAGSFFAKNSEVLSILDNLVCFKNM